MLLFVATVFTTCVAGAAWLNIDPFEITNIARGLPYAAALLFILATHEFGHYFASKFHHVDATLPYFIPFPTLPGFLNFGTLGAVIKTRSPVPTKKAMFDIGVAGPIAGFVASLIVLIYGFTHLPGREFITTIHPDYFVKPEIGGLELRFGTSIAYEALSLLLTNPANQFVPPMTEMYHYPFLCTGWFGLFVTAMNLFPIGQLDGGHVSYAMFGHAHQTIARTAFALLLTIGLMGFLPAAGIEVHFGWTGWLFWAAVLFFIVKLTHPPVMSEEPLDPWRMKVGWLAWLIFAVSFAPSPFSILF
ncbi:MAG TPA: site-2 protease family protein [Bacteroidota bacterium]|nr:site-2 protease family protein [Bacteroidota bacterium]